MGRGTRVLASNKIRDALPVIETERPPTGNRIEPAEPDTLESYWLSEPGVFYMGSGGLASTAADYFRFADMLLHGGRRPGGPRILSRKTVELMTKSHIGDRFMTLGGPGQGFGLGFGVALDRGRAHTMPTEGSYTWGGAFNTHWWNDPAEELFGPVAEHVSDGAARFLDDPEGIDRHDRI